MASFKNISYEEYQKIYDHLKTKGNYVFKSERRNSDFCLLVEVVKSESGIIILTKEEYVEYKCVYNVNLAYYDKIKAEMLEGKTPVNKHKTGQTSHLRLWSDKGQEYLNVSPEEYRELERLANVEKEKAFQEAVDDLWYQKRYVD